MTTPITPVSELDKTAPDYVAQLERGLRLTEEATILHMHRLSTSEQARTEGLITQLRGLGLTVETTDEPEGMVGVSIMVAHGDLSQDAHEQLEGIINSLNGGLKTRFQKIISRLEEIHVIQQGYQQALLGLTVITPLGMIDPERRTLHVYYIDQEGDAYEAHLDLAHPRGIAIRKCVDDVASELERIERESTDLCANEDMNVILVRNPSRAPPRAAIVKYAIDMQGSMILGARKTPENSGSSLVRSLRAAEYALMMPKSENHSDEIRDNPPDK